MAGVADPWGAMLAPENESNTVGALHSDPSLVDLRKAELTVHWKTLQDFLLQWGSRQEQLLMCDDTNALLDAAQIHLLELGHPHDTDDCEHISNSKDAVSLQIDNGGEATNNGEAQAPIVSAACRYKLKGIHNHQAVGVPVAASFQCPEIEIPEPISPKAFSTHPSDPSSMSDGLGSPGAVSYSASEYSASPGHSTDRLAQIKQLQHFRSSRTGSLDTQTRFKHAMSTCVTRKGFDMLCGVVIFGNAVVTGASSDYGIKNPNQETPAFFSRCETFFIVFYTLEIVLRVQNERIKYFTGKDKKWNMFDVTLVIQGIAEQIQLLVMGSSDGGLSGLSFLRLLRLMKMLKLLRMIRLLRMFRELRLILSSIFACGTSMVWTGVLILAITYLFGIAFVQACTAYLQQDPDTIDPKTRESIAQYWNSAATAILSLYMASLGGQDWEVIVEPLGQVGLNGAYYFIFLVYIAVFAFVVMNVVSSIFLESILTHADKDQQLTIETQMEQKEDYIHRLQALYDLLDDDKSGEISYDEFCSQVHSPHMQAFAASLQIDISDARKFFLDISDRGKRPVDMDTFVVGCIKLKGMARSVDLCELKYAHTKSYAAQQKASRELHAMATKHHKTVKDLHELAAQQNTQSEARKAFEQRMLLDLRTLVACVQKMGVSGAAAVSPATTQGTNNVGSHLQL